MLQCFYHSGPQTDRAVSMCAANLLVEVIMTHTESSGGQEAVAQLCPTKLRVTHQDITMDAA